MNDGGATIGGGGGGGGGGRAEPHVQAQHGADVVVLRTVGQVYCVPPKEPWLLKLGAVVP